MRCAAGSWLSLLGYGACGCASFSRIEIPVHEAEGPRRLWTAQGRTSGIENSSARTIHVNMNLLNHMILLTSALSGAISTDQRESSRNDERSSLSALRDASQA